MSILSPQAVTRLWDEHRNALVLYARQWCDAPGGRGARGVSAAGPPGCRPRESGRLAVSGGAEPGDQRRAIARTASRRETAAAARGEPWFEPAEGDRLDAAAATDALKHLPIEQREVIVARLWGGLSFEEIARLSEIR